MRSKMYQAAEEVKKVQVVRGMEDETRKDEVDGVALDQENYDAGANEK